jgi:hypothetical protein
MTDERHDLAAFAKRAMAEEPLITKEEKLEAAAALEPRKVAKVLKSNQLVRSTAGAMAAMVFQQKGLTQEQKVRLSAVDLAAILNACIHRYFQDHELNV